MLTPLQTRLRNTLLTIPLVAALSVAISVPAHAAETIDDARPDRIALTPTQTPENSQAITWRTGAEVTEGFVSIRPANSDEAWRDVAARQNDPLNGEQGFDVRTHSATIDGLAPATTYEYTVGTADVRSDVWSFTTASAENDPFTFIYFGDAQNQLSDTWGPVVNSAFAHYPEAIGTVHAGDLINRSNSSEWTEWFGGMDGFSQKINVIAAPGNHEYTDDSFMRHWKSNFEYPANGPQWAGEAGTTPAAQQVAAYRAHMAEVLTETAYFTDYQGVRFISLNASRSQARTLFTPDDLPYCLIGCPDPVALWLEMQSNWLDEILANNPGQWAVATFHQPVFSTATGRDEKDLRDAWLPVFQRNDIDLVLMGHDHTYARGYVNSDATHTPGVTTGPVYAVSVAGPKYYDQQPVDNNVWTQNGATQVVRAGHTSTFQGITVDGDTLTYEAIVAEKWSGDASSTTDVPIGGVLDSFTITKFADGTKFVTEAGVAVPEPGEANPVDPPAEMPEEEAAETPAEVDLAHFDLGTLTSPTVNGPIAFEDATGTLFIGDASETGVGRIEAIDVATDTVLRSFDIGTPVTAMSHTPAEGGLLLVASTLSSAGRANGFSTNPAFFGAPALSDDIPMPAKVRDLGIDPGAGLVYFALEAGAVVIVDIDEGDIAGQLLVGPGLQGLEVDEATGNVYIVDSSEHESTLSIYAARLGGDPILTGQLAGNALGIDLDPAAGIAYMSHTGPNAGVSAFDVLGESVLHEPLTATFDVATAPSLGRVYVATETGVTVMARAQAPTIVSSPQAVVVDLHESATLTAAATATPAPSVQWQSRGEDGWVDLPDAISTELVVTPATSTQFRAVFSNQIDETTFTTATATATVVVRQPAIVTPTEPPAEQPGVVSPEAFTPETQGEISANVDGRTITVHLGDGHDGEWVATYLHSTPEFLGWNTVNGNVFTVQAPATATGTHTLAVLNSTGDLIGWATVTLAAGEVGAGGDSPSASGERLSATGGANLVLPLAAGSIVLLFAGCVIVYMARQREAIASNEKSQSHEG